METPRMMTRSRHVPTPKMSDRKKSLFGAQSSGLVCNAEEDSDLGPMSPLKFSNSPKRGPMKDLNITSFRNILGNASPESDRSLSPDFERRFTHSERYEILPASHDKENQMMDEETRLSFSNSTPRMRNVAESTQLDENNSNSLSMLMNSDLNIVDKKNAIMKTPGLSQGAGQKKEPKTTFRKSSFQENVLTPSDSGNKSNSFSESTGESRARTSLSFSNIRPISTKSFYSSSTTEVAQKPVTKPSPTYSVVSSGRVPQRRSTSHSRKPRSRSKKRDNSIRLGGINRGVFHKIKRYSAKAKAAKETVKKLSTSQILESTASLFNKSLPTANIPVKSPSVQCKSAPTSPQNPKPLKAQIERIKKILSDSRKNPIEQARPLSFSKSMTDLTGELYNDDDSEDQETDVEDDDGADDAKSDGGGGGGGRKFFKSSSNRRIKREYKVVNNVTATVRKGGKLALKSDKPRKRKHPSMFEDEIDLASEQLEVDFLISKLVGSQGEQDAEHIPVKQSTPLKTYSKPEPQPIPPATVQVEFIDAIQSEISNDEPIPMQSNVIYVDRLSPLMNGIGTSGESSCSSTRDGNCIQPDYQESPTTQIRTMTSSMSISRAVNVSKQFTTGQSQVESNKLFPIFYKDHQRMVAAQSQSEQDTCHGLFDAVRRKPKRLRISFRGAGSNQYQIDAGQKAYGALQCPECGLLYSVHEPEEELIHENYHNSLHILRFPGWGSEAVIAHVPEWDVSGRVLAVGMTANQNKLHKVQEVLGVVDRELGYVEPCQLVLGSVVYLAVARGTILGICVAQPLQHANRLLTIEGLEGPLDCCTMETYPVKCGISRIWVSPSFRGHGIAQTLLTVLRSHFVFGYQLSYDEIAFSAPTEAGKRLAETVTGRKDFLIYM
nr:N-acetyltransferase eco [Aedes albopictus]